MAFRDRRGDLGGSLYGIAGFDLVRAVCVHRHDPSALRCQAVDTAYRIFRRFYFAHAHSEAGLKIVPTNADALIGMQAVVIEPIDNLHAKGQVRVRGQVWTARSADGDVTFEEGQTVNIVKIEGVKLICSQPSKT